MQLRNGHHLSYCTNIHPGETWAEVFAALEQYTLAVRERVSPRQPYGIGLRLSDRASRELHDPGALLQFRRWLERHRCYIFTINGFPFGRFHGDRIKEQAYLPDWTSPERLDYTNRLFDLLANLMPHGIEGSVSSVPGSFKELVKGPDQLRAIRANIFHCVEYAARLSAQTGRRLHLALEPEPLCLMESTAEAVVFFDRLRAEHHNDPRLTEFLGINYDTCHIATEFEVPAEAVARLRQHHVKISKIHISSALKVRPTPQARQALKAFADDTYLHQVIVRDETGKLTRHRDLVDFLALPVPADESAHEWRIHFHIPLHCEPNEWMDTTSDHIQGVLDVLAADPALCTGLEMETYTWEVLPPQLRERTVVDQLTSEYEWCLGQLHQRKLA